MNIVQQLRRLEAAFDRQQREIEALRRQRRRRHGRDIPVRLARTAEEEPAGSGSHGYPTYSDTCAELPIVFVDLHKPSTTLTRTDRSEYANTMALANFGWLPPDLEVWVTEGDDGRWRFVDVPRFVRGLLTVAASAAVIANSSGGTGDTTCDDWTDGGGTLHVWRHSTGVVWTPQTYSNGDPVLLTLSNPTDSDLEVNRPTFANLDAADRKWLAVPAWCDVPSCTAE